MKKIFLASLIVICISSPLYAAQSAIVDVDGKACMGDDKSRNQTEQAAINDAKRRAVEFTSTYLKSETQINEFIVEKDLLAAYANAEVRIIQEIEKVWYKDAASGDCYKVRIKAEVIPDEKAMQKAAQAKSVPDKEKELLEKQKALDEEKKKLKTVRQVEPSRPALTEADPVPPPGYRIVRLEVPFTDYEGNDLWEMSMADKMKKYGIDKRGNKIVIEYQRIDAVTQDSKINNPTPSQDSKINNPTPSKLNIRRR